MNSVGSEKHDFEQSGAALSHIGASKPLRLAAATSVCSKQVVAWVVLSGWAASSMGSSSIISSEDLVVSE